MTSKYYRKKGYSNKRNPVVRVWIDGQNHREEAKNMRTATFSIPGDPAGKGRPRFSGRSGRAYTPAATTEYENKVRLAYSQQTRCTRLNGAIRADITAYFKIPKSTPKKKVAELAEEHTPCLKAPDADNIAKIVLDALNGLAYEDDKAVIYLTVGKLYGSTPRVEVTLTEVKG